MTSEQIFTALAVPEGLPREAMVEAGLHREEMIPVFLDLIHRLRRATSESVAEDDLSAFLFVFFLLGEWRDNRAYRPLTDLLRCDPDFLERLLGDAVTDGTARVIAGVFDGDLTPILEVLEDPAADMFVRSQMIDALVLIARRHPEKASEIETFMEGFFDAGFEKPDVLWESWAFALAELGLAHLEPKVLRAYQEEWIPSDMSTFGDFRHALRDATETGTSSWFHQSRNTGPIDSAIDELSRWYCFSDAYRRDRRTWREDGGRKLANFFGDTFERKELKVGRNDPCPCGSGKKYKKCCLH